VARHNNTLEKHNRVLEKSNLQLTALVDKNRKIKHPATISPSAQQAQESGNELENYLEDQGTAGMILMEGCFLTVQGEESEDHDGNMDDQPVPQNAVEPKSVQESNEIGRREVFQGLRSCELRCNDINLANACLSAYFRHVHPVIPVLHRDAFYGLYQLYGEKALYKQALMIRDGSTKEGRAVSLICAVLALGALTLDEVDILRLGNPIDGSEQSLFGLGLGFYGTSLRLSAYTHDSIETMFTYFFMVYKPHHLRCILKDPDD